jgi:hypothetical protein
MEGLDLQLWSAILLSCDWDTDYVDMCVALVPKKWQSYFLTDPVAQIKRRRRFTIGRKLLSQRVWVWEYKGMLHREDDEPAVIDRTLGICEWYYLGLKHRVGGPAFECWHDGIEEWWENGKKLK